MTIESIIYSKLASVGAAYPLSIPTGGTLPGMAYQFVSEVDYPSHSGAGLVRRRLQVSCWGKTYAAAITLGDSVKVALSFDKQNIELIAPANGAQDFKDPEASLYRRIVEFYVWN
jgi:hypothetical protein